MKHWLGKAVILPIRGYQLFVSPMLGPRCRFHPSCSQYAIEAVQTHGAFKGLWLAVRRVLRCHPLHPGGHDPVPSANSEAMQVEKRAMARTSPLQPLPTDSSRRFRKTST